MKAHRKVRVHGSLLLLVYSVCTLSVALFHHHHDQHPTYLHTTDCEKEIYFSNKGKHCPHESHVAQAPEKCFLCDHQTVSPHSIPAFFTYASSKLTFTKISEKPANFYVLTPSNGSNRGPPSISSLIV